MIRGLRVFVFMLTLVLEVRIHAAETEPRIHLVQQPANCLQHNTLCAIRTTQDPDELALTKNRQLTLDRRSTVIRVSQKQLKLIEGMLWAQGESELEVETEFGSFIGQGEFWLERKVDNKVQVSVISGDFKILPRGLKESVQVLPGHQNWLGAVGMDGKATTGVPQAIDFSLHLKRWKRLYRGPEGEWKSQAEAFFRVWQGSLQSASEFQKHLAERWIAEAREAQERRWAGIQKVREEEEVMRELFRQKVFGFPSP